MTRLTLVRHGQTEWNRARRIQGTSDIPLNETGRAQARAVGRLLAERRRWDVVASSPLSRAAETAELIAVELVVAGSSVDSPLLVPGVSERSYGEAEGMTGEELRLRHPGGIEEAPIPGLESRASVVARATKALTDLSARFGAEASVLVATHGAVIGSLMRALTAETLPPAGVTVGNGSAHDFELLHGELSLVAFDGSGDVLVVETVENH